MAGGKDKGKRTMEINSSNEDMEDAHDLGTTQGPLPALHEIRHMSVHSCRNYTLLFDDNKKEFTCAPQLTEDVKHTFEKKLATRLRDMFYTVTHKMRGAKPGWLIEDVHKKMMDIVAADSTYKKRSAQNKKNRRGGSMENPIEATHYQGSMSAVQHAKRMAAKNKGQLLTAHELFMKTHFKEVPGKGTVPANTKAQHIAEACQKKFEEASTQGIQKSPNELYWETVGGRNKKGRVKGLGQGAELYYGDKKGSKSSQQYTPSFLSQMQDQMD
ncbi:uncharacterized protein LOC110696317 [Chenopodium quinoa]|uniref:uncharacterized protein LOC110696317 n=1 Tax=Chenopodium quinoa TaxID=63459 RepID=UPI000B78D1A8|nr:uncharacterized protein LOC110696317 [Chenopodium quinoa]